MIFIHFIFLFIIDIVNADFCMLDSPQPECDGYCYALVKPFLSYIPSMQKRLEACETLTSPYGQDALDKINDQLAQLLMRNSEKGQMDKFRRIGNKYYYIEDSQMQTWMGALQQCSKLGGHLANLENIEEWENLKNHLCEEYDYWIDVNDLEEEGTFISATTGNPPKFLIWEFEEPNDGTYKNEECVELRSEYSFHMNDRICSHYIGFICEADHGQG